MRSRGFLTVLDLVFVMPLSGSVEFDAAHRDVRLRGSQRSGCWKSLDFRTRVGSSRSYHAAEFNVVRVGRQSPNSKLSLKTSLGLDASDEASGVKRIPRGDGAFPHYEGDSALPCRRLSTLSGGLSSISPPRKARQGPERSGVARQPRQAVSPPAGCHRATTWFDDERG